MDNPLESKTITLSCGKLTTGVTVKPWTGIFMLRNLSSKDIKTRIEYENRLITVINASTRLRKELRELEYIG